MTPDEVSGNPSRPEGFTVLLADYERHLTAERDLSTHSVRAYIGDVADLLEHLIRLGHDDLGSLDIRGL
ncbi:MAG TPA: site-specific integrase, partial [Kribbella sp.]|nr:site-specific integrase [Kribbella sp.]